MTKIIWLIVNWRLLRFLGMKILYFKNITLHKFWNLNKISYFEFNKSGHYTIVAYDEETGCIDSVSFNYSAEIIPDTYFNPDELGNNKWNIKFIYHYS